ncbi:MAG: hypothetical protein IBJ11_11120 [Phycisphaerales bacterium]|nr:hypothetical protein [Phycisphaerales bacterium]
MPRAISAAAALLLVVSSTAALRGQPVPAAAEPATPKAPVPAAPPAKAAAEYDLRPRLSAGTQARYRVTLSSEQGVFLAAVPEGQGRQSSSMRMEVVVLIKVAEAKPGADARVDLVYQELKFRAEAAETKVEFDSARPDPVGPASPNGPQADPSSAELRKFLGSAVRLGVDPLGNLTNIEPPADLPPEVLAAAAGFLTPEVIRDAFSPIFSAQKPSGVAKLGETWTVSDSADGAPGPRLIISAEHALKTVSSNLATIDIVGTLSLDPTDDRGGKAELKESTHKGSIVWDLTAGLLRNSTRELRFRTSLDLQGFGVETHRSSSTKVERLD